MPWKLVDNDDGTNPFDDPDAPELTEEQIRENVAWGEVDKQVGWDDSGPWPGDVNWVKGLVDAAAIKHNVNGVELLRRVLFYLYRDFGRGWEAGDTVEQNLNRASELTNHEVDRIMRELGVIGKQ